MKRMVLLLLLAGPAAPLAGQGQPESLVRRYAGSYETNQLLADSRVRGELAAVLGAELAHLRRNLFVAGSVDLIGGWLAISGNAAHQGGEEEAIVCIAEKPVTVQAAILTGGRIRAFSRVQGYDGLSICIKDWITQANSAHRDRFQKPANVDLIRPRP
jgi:hypothetical protein